LRIESGTVYNIFNRN